MLVSEPVEVDVDELIEFWTLLDEDREPLAGKRGPTVRRVRMSAHQRTPTREGIALAKRGGAYRGRRKALTTDQSEQLRAGATAGKPKAALAREFGTSRETVY